MEKKLSLDADSSKSNNGIIGNEGTFPTVFVASCP